MNENFDAARLTLLLSELRLPATKQIWAAFAEQSDKEGWPAVRLLTVIVENELAERDRRRIERHLAEARLLPGKTLDNFDFNAVPTHPQHPLTPPGPGPDRVRPGAPLHRTAGTAPLAPRSHPSGCAARGAGLAPRPGHPQDRPCGRVGRASARSSVARLMRDSNSRESRHERKDFPPSPTGTSAERGA
mgnify:CR=1 FL=1